MQAQNVLGPPLAKTCPYTGLVPHKPSKARPAQGAHLLRLRKSAGLTQMELGEFLGVPHSNIVFWEWSDKPPRSDLLPKLAQALNTSVEGLLTSKISLISPNVPVPSAKCSACSKRSAASLDISNAASSKLSPLCSTSTSARRVELDGSSRCAIFSPIPRQRPRPH